MYLKTSFYIRKNWVSVVKSQTAQPVGDHIPPQPWVQFAIKTSLKTNGCFGHPRQ